MADYIDTYYVHTLDENRSRPALEGPVEADVCIIGGGLAGLNVALGLLERGVKKVVILEGKRIAFGASGRNGGKVLTGFAGGIEKLLARVDMAHAKKIYALTVEALPLIKKRVKEFKIDCDLRDGVMICSWYDDAQGLKDEIEFERSELGLRAEFYPRERLRDLFRSKRYYDGQFYPGWFHLHPLRYARGLADAVERKGGVIYEDSMATSVSRSGSSVTVMTAKGSVKANRVVYCTSAYSNGVEPRLQRSAVRVSSYMMTTQTIAPEKLAFAINTEYGCYDTRWATDYYRALPDHRILWGGGVGIENPTLPAHTGEHLLQALLKVYPQLDGVKVETAWVGTMASTVHRIPHIGRFNEREWYSTNFGNNGLGPTVAAGEVIAAGIAKGDETWKLFEPFGLDYAGGVIGPYVAQGVYHYWKLRDKVRQLKEERKRA